MSKTPAQVLYVHALDAHAEELSDALTSEQDAPKVTVAHDLEQARARIAECAPDLVITDCVLPDGKGVELLPADGDGPCFPVVVMVDRGQEQAGAEAVEAGALDCVSKSGFAPADVPRLADRALRQWRHILARQRAEDALTQAERRFDSIVKSLPDIIYRLDREGKITFISDAVKQYGYSPADLVGKSMFEIVHPQDMDKARYRVNERRTGGRRTMAFEVRLLTKDLQSVPLEVHSTSGEDGRTFLLEAEGLYATDEPRTQSFLGTQGIARDISDRKSAEEALRESEENLSITLNSIGDAVIATDVRGQITRMNPVAEELTGWPSAEAMGRDHTDVFRLIHAETREPADSPVTNALRSGSVVELAADTSLVTKDGTERRIADSAAPIRDRTGEVVGGVLVFRDVSEQYRLEERLRQALKMESIGRLAGGVAHDFNNLLSPIIGYADMVLEQLHKEDPLYSNIQVIRDAGQSAAKLTEQLLAFSRKQVLQVRVLNLTEVVIGLQRMLPRLIGEHIELENSLAPSLGCVKADRSQIQQILLNLAANARDAMPDGGKLVIKTENVVLDEAYARMHEGARPGPYVLLAISDTGQGMDARTLNHIFEPFFTTKARGKGVGLGLATVYGIVKQHEGYIWVESRPGQGTTFQIYLPRLEGEAKDEEEQPLPGEAAGGTETIMVVEDDKLVRKLACDILESSGYTVIEAHSPEEALRISERHKGHIDLLLTDVIMPQLSGRQLHEMLAPLRPDMKVLYMSGYPDDLIAHHGVLHSGINFLQKPFSYDLLSRRIRETLDK